ncbi:MAG: glycosyltransferase [Candidatus Acidiferrales bacterium]
MTKSPHVSVVIPCFNHGEFLPGAVASVTSINRDDVELIVVDDGSTDELTRKAVAALSAQGIRTICQENKGLAAARNLGISASQGKYILPLDADNRIRAAYIERGIQTLDAEPQIGVVYGDAEYTGTRTGRWHVGPLNLNRLLQWNYIDACAVYRRAVWEQNGGYDGAMPVQGLEDWDFWLGAVEHDWAFHYVPQVLFDYRVAEESMISRAAKFKPQIEKFIANKHGLLYRQAWIQREWERGSGRATLANLRRIVKARLKHKLDPNGAQDWICPR